jgi:riboflavin kinase/FMN adenylyltransferase
MPTMQVTELERVTRRPRHVAIGTFDGVHLGHRAVIEGADTAITFVVHPLTVLRPEAAPKQIVPFAVKRDLIAARGVVETVLLPFDARFARLEPEEFITDVLVGRLGAEVVSVGENFRFGARGRGTAELLAGRPEFETRVRPLVEVDGERVSSTRIRALIAAGDLAGAERCLGGRYTIEADLTEVGRRWGVARLDERLVGIAPGEYRARVAGVRGTVAVAGRRVTFELEDEVPALRLGAPVRLRLYPTPRPGRAGDRDAAAPIQATDTR